MKKITITLVSPSIITNPPKPDAMDLQITGLLPIEAVHLLLSACSQIAANELPPIIEALKATAEQFPMATPGKA